MASNASRNRSRVVASIFRMASPVGEMESMRSFRCVVRNPWRFSSSSYCSMAIMLTGPSRSILRRSSAMASSGVSGRPRRAGRCRAAGSAHVGTAAATGSAPARRRLFFGLVGVDRAPVGADGAVALHLLDFGDHAREVHLQRLDHAVGQVGEIALGLGALHFGLRRAPSLTASSGLARLADGVFLRVALDRSSLTAFVGQADQFARRVQRAPVRRRAPAGRRPGPGAAGPVRRRSAAARPAGTVSRVSISRCDFFERARPPGTPRPRVRRGARARPSRRAPCRHAARASSRASKSRRCASARRSSTTRCLSASWAIDARASNCRVSRAAISSSQRCRVAGHEFAFLLDAPGVFVGLAHAEFEADDGLLLLVDGRRRTPRWPRRCPTLARSTSARRSPVRTSSARSPSSASRTSRMSRRVWRMPVALVAPVAADDGVRATEDVAVARGDGGRRQARRRDGLRRTTRQSSRTWPGRESRRRTDRYTDTTDDSGTRPGVGGTGGSERARPIRRRRRTRSARRRARARTPARAPRRRASRRRRTGAVRRGTLRRPARSPA